MQIALPIMTSSQVSLLPPPSPLSCVDSSSPLERLSRAHCACPAAAAARHCAALAIASGPRSRLTFKKLLRELLSRPALPAALLAAGTSLLVFALNLEDVAMIGHLLNPEALARLPSASHST